MCVSHFFDRRANGAPTFFIYLEIRNFNATPGSLPWTTRGERTKKEGMGLLMLGQGEAREHGI